jgi:hypothetical protein
MLALIVEYGAEGYKEKFKQYLIFFSKIADIRIANLPYQGRFRVRKFS